MNIRLDQSWYQSVSQATEFVSLMDSAYCLLFVNHGQSGAEDYVGRSVFDYVDAKYHDILREIVERARASGMPQHYESLAVGPDSDESRYSNWVMAVRDADQDVVVFVATDVTRAGRMETELSVSETTLRSLIDSSPDSILIVDRSREAVFINRPDYGYVRDDIIGHRAEMFVSPADRARVKEGIDFVLRTGEVTSFESQLDTPQGARRLTTRLAPIFHDGAVDRVMLVSTDITSRVEAEKEHQRLLEELHQAQKMEAIGQLTGGVAHDFNNLLTAISGNLELAQLDISASSPSAEFIQDALDAVYRAGSLTQRLLAFSRKQALRPQTIDVQELLVSMRNLLDRTLGETIAVHVAPADDLWQCHVDPGQLENAIINLAVNARDAMPRGGKLSISSRNHAVYSGSLGEQADTGARDDIEPGDYVCIEVADTGVGMSAEITARVFDPFFTTKEVGKGSGLGLSMVYGWVHQSGGHVQIESAHGEGCKVQIYLPRIDETSGFAQRESGVDEVPRGNGELILVVEDDSQVRSVAIRILAALGYRTVEAENAALALRLLEYRSAAI
jgi:two-component system, chemotaxis family, CheB/CheR fusion protein